MAEERCEFAIWDVGGNLLEEVRGKLSRRLVHNGPKIAVEAGEWLGRRLAIGRPQRVIAKQAPTLAEALQAMVAAHRPQRLVVLGPARACSTAYALGQVVAVAQVVEANETTPVTQAEGAQRLTYATIGNGTVAASTRMTTDWAKRAAVAIAGLGIDATLFAVVTETSSAEAKTLEPPVSRPLTNSRRAGVVLGKLLAGKLDFGDAKREPQLAVARVIESLIR